MATMTFWTVSARRQTVLARSRRFCWRRCNTRNSNNNKNRLALTSTMDYSSSRSSSSCCCCSSGLTMLPNRLSVKTKNLVLSCSLATAAKASVLNDNDSDYSNDSHNNTNKDTVIPFLLADIGEGIKEVELLTWYVQAGDTVQEFDAVCQVQSDKATVDITSRYAGVVTQLGAAVGDFVQVGKPLLFLNSTTTATATNTTESKNHSDNTDTHPSMSSLPSLAEQMAADAETNWQEDRLNIPKMATHYTLEHDHENASMPLHKVLTSPAVRKLATEHELDLRTLRGSGPQGRILKQDVLQYIRQQQTSAPQVTTKTPSAETQETSVSMSLPPAAAATTKTTTQVPTMALPQESSEIIQLKGYSRSMVQTMTAALQIPHMTLGDEVQLDRILQLRKEWKHNDSAKMGNSNQNNNNNFEVSVLAFMLKACSLALTEFPILNASIHDLETCQVQVHHHHHIGVAMDTPRGLLVPAIQFVQQKSLLDIQSDLNALKDQAISMTGGGGGVDSSVLNPTFTLSNIGALGVGQTMSAVLAPPQVAMGAVGRMQRIPRFTSDHNDASGNGDKNMQVQAVQVANVSWTADHRVVDGATLARFHQRFASYLQDPTRMLRHCK